MLMMELQDPASVASNTFDDGIIPSPCQRLASQTSGSSIHPDDIWYHIHSLMTIDDAARAACLSRAFLSSWRCYPKLDLGLNTLCPKRDDQNLMRRIDSIMRSHSGTGLKVLKLGVGSEKSCLPYVDGWLQAALTPGIQEIDLWLLEEYNFPCSTLFSSDGVRNSVQSLSLCFCTFHPVLGLGPMRSLTRLVLVYVRITGEELECLLANSLALEHLKLGSCKEIILLKIPSLLLKLSYLEVSACWDLQVVENKAPNLSTFILTGEVSKFSLGGASPMIKAFTLLRTNAVSYARAELPSIMSNLEYLHISSITNQVHTSLPMVPTKFLNLKHLSIQISEGISSQPYDYIALATCFLDASPCLETWRLDVHGNRGKHESVFEGPLHLRQLPQHLKLKSVEIIGFTSAKILVELTCCIAKSAVSLERLTLNTSDGFAWCSGENNCQDLCCPIRKVVLDEASRAVVAITRYIEDKVPPTTRLTVVEPCPCPRCRSVVGDK